MVLTIRNIYGSYSEVPVCVYDAKGNKVQGGCKEVEISALSAVMISAEMKIRKKRVK